MLVLHLICPMTDFRALCVDFCSAWGSATDWSEQAAAGDNLAHNIGAALTESDGLAARRPKPPSLAEQALEAVNALEGFKGVDTIRRALEQLDD